jgi:hypothetical protein
VSRNSEPSKRRVVGFVGIGLDNQDGHKRLTRTEHFYLIGGSEETHEHMQDAAIRFAEELERRGKILEQTPVQEIIEIFHDSRE